MAITLTPENISLSNQEGILTGVKSIRIDGVSAADDSLAYISLVSDPSYAMGKSWSGNLPALRVMSQNVRWVAGKRDSSDVFGQWRGEIHYSTQCSDDILMYVVMGGTSVGIIKDIADAAFANNAVVNLPLTTLVMMYERTECDQGYWWNGILRGWANPRPAWGHQAYTSAASQLNYVRNTLNTRNAYSFAGQTSGVWKFTGAPTQLLPDIGLGYDRYRVQYSFEMRPYLGSVDWADKQVAATDTDVYTTSNFGLLELIWPDTGESL